MLLDESEEKIHNARERLQLKSVTKELTGHKKRVYTLDWNINGSKLASGSVDCSIKVIEILKINIDMEYQFRQRL